MRKNVSLTVTDRRPAEDFFKRNADIFERKFDEFPAEVLTESGSPYTPPATEPPTLPGGLDISTDTPPCPQGSSDGQSVTVQGSPLREYHSIGSDVPNNIYADSTSRWFNGVFQLFNSSSQPGGDSWTSGAQSERDFVGLSMLSPGITAASIHLMARVNDASGTNLPWEIVEQDWDFASETPALGHDTGGGPLLTGSGSADVDITWDISEKTYTNMAQFALRYVTAPAGTHSIRLIAHSSFAAEGVGWKAWALPAPTYIGGIEITEVANYDGGVWVVPAPIKYIVRITVDGTLMMDMDYTFSGNAVTFVSTVSATSLVKVDYVTA